MCVQKLMLGCGGVTFDLKALFGKYTTKVNVTWLSSYNASRANINHIKLILLHTVIFFILIISYEKQVF